jgi:hypothetical protein
MKKAVVMLTGRSSMIQSRAHMEPKLPKEQPDPYEQRTWMNKLHQSDGFVHISGDGLKKSLDTAVSRLGEKTKGRATYAKHFKSGCRTDLLKIPTNVPIEKVTKLSLFCDVSKGSGTRVMRLFPEIPSGWKSKVEFLITDDMIDRDVFLRSLTEAGKLVGIGSFRVENGGRCGMFAVELISWEDVTL